jgi:hypothetical protein
MDTSSCSQFQTKFEIAVRTGQNTLNGWREERYPTVMLHYHPKYSKDQRKAGNKFRIGQRPTL